MNISQSTTFWRALLGVSLTVLLGLGWLVNAFTASAALDVPQLLQYQGRLTDASRITVDDGTVSMKFAIYDASSGGNCLWSAANNDADSATIDCTGGPEGELTVTVTDGIFSVLLGDTSDSQNALDDELFDDNASLFLGVTIDSDLEMTPRKRIASAPYALQAGDADLLDSLDTDNDGCTAACVPVTNSVGNLVITGDPGSGGATPLSVNPSDAKASEAIFVAAEGGTSYFTILGNGFTEVENHLSVNDTASADTVIAASETYDAAVTAGNVYGSTMTLTIQGDYNTASNEVVQGVASNITLDATAATDEINHVANYYAAYTHNGDGTTDNWRGLEIAASGSSGTLTNARGVEVLLSGTTVTNAYGGFFDVTGATSSNIALYTGRGSVVIDGSDSPLGNTPDNATGNGELYVVGDIEVDANLYADGNTTLGNAATDTVTFTADVASNILPDQNDSYTLGNMTERWADLYLGPNSLHIGGDADEGIIGYDTTNDYIEFDTDGDGTEEVAFVKGASDEGEIRLGDANSGFVVLEGGQYNSTPALITGNAINAQNSIFITNSELSIAASRNTDVGLYIAEDGFTGDQAGNDDTGAYIALTSDATGVASAYRLEGTKTEVTYGGTGANTSVYGDRYDLFIEGSAADGSYGGYADVQARSSASSVNLTGYYGTAYNNASSSTVGNAYGVRGEAGSAAASGTTTTAYGVYGDAFETAGTLTTGYGGWFTTGGATTGVGVYANASGGTAYSIYTEAGHVHIDGSDIGSATTPNDATGNGELFVKGDIETDSALFVDNTSSSTSAATVNSIDVDFTDTGIVTTGTDINNGIDIGISRSGATGGTINTVGANIILTSDDAASGTANVIGTYNDSRNGDYNYGVFASGISGAGTEPSLFSGGSGINVGLLAHADGGSSNYAIYTSSGYVQIDNDMSPAVPDDANSDGSLFVSNHLEVDAATYIDLTSTSTVVDTETGLDIDYQHTGVTTDAGSDKSHGIDIDLDRTGATGGSTEISAIGLKLDIDTDTLASKNAAYGLYIEADGGDVDYALYAASGYLHIDDDTTRDAPTFGAVGADGTAFFHNDVEIYDGSLCVGDGGTDDCSGLPSPTDGVIYSTAASVTQHDLAEAFPSKQFLLAGDIVSVSNDSNENVARTVQGDVIIGAVSTSPGLILGWETEAQGYYPVALTGRAPVKVNDEGGVIEIGDRIAQSSVEGIGMKATGEGEVVGIAMEAFNGPGQGAVVTFIQPHYWDGASEASITEVVPEPVVQVDAVLSINNGIISNIARLEGMTWSIDETGAFVTEGSYAVEIESYQNTKVTTYAALGLEQYITLAGTTEFNGAPLVIVEFEEISPEFNDVVSNEVPIIVTATMSDGSGDVYVTDKSSNGFTINRSGGNGTQVDWMVMGVRRGTEAEEDLEAEEVLDEEIEEPEVADSSEEEQVEEEDVAEDVADEEAVELAEEVDMLPDEEQVSDPADDLPEEEPVVEVLTEEDTEPEAQAAEEEPEVVAENEPEETVAEATEEIEDPIPEEVEEVATE